jgi:hypothetical protein
VLAASATGASAGFTGPQTFKNVKVTIGSSTEPPPSHVPTVVRLYCESKGYDQFGPYQFIAFQKVGWKHVARFKEITCRLGGSLEGVPTIGIPLP